MVHYRYVKMIIITGFIIFIIITTIITIITTTIDDFEYSIECVNDLIYSGS